MKPVETSPAANDLVGQAGDQEFLVVPDALKLEGTQSRHQFLACLVASWSVRYNLGDHRIVERRNGIALAIARHRPLSRHLAAAGNARGGRGKA